MTILIAFLVILALLKGFQIAWMIYNYHQFQRTIDLFYQDCQETLEWLEELKTSN